MKISRMSAVVMTILLLLFPFIFQNCGKFDSTSTYGSETHSPIEEEVGANENNSSAPGSDLLEDEKLPNIPTETDEAPSREVGNNGSSPPAEVRPPMSSDEKNSLPENNCLPQNLNLPFEFYRNAYMPSGDDNLSYRHYPGSGYFAGERNIKSLQTSVSKADGFFFLWANRCHDIKGSGCGHNPKGNLPAMKIGGKEQRFYFSTHNIANMCTLAQVYNLFGVSEDTIRKLADNHGFRLAFNENQLETYAKNHGQFQDYCYLYGKKISDSIEGVVIDYEVQDNRSSSTTANFIKRLSKFIHSRERKFHLWTNPIGKSGWKLNGFSQTTNREVFAAFDKVSILYYGGDPNTPLQSLGDQLSYWPTNSNYRLRQKVYVIAGLGRISVTEAKQIRNIVLNKKLGGIAIWNDGAKYGGPGACNSSSYRKIKCLAYGECP